MFCVFLVAFGRINKVCLNFYSTLQVYRTYKFKLVSLVCFISVFFLSNFNHVFFRSKDEDIDLVPVEEFLKEAPETISRPVSVYY